MFHYSRIEDGAISGDPPAFHSIHDALSELGVRYDEDGFGLGLDDELVSDRDHVWPALRARVPDPRVRISLLDRADDALAISDERGGCRPEDAARGHVGVEQREARPDAGPRSDDDDLLEQVGCVEEPVHGCAADPELLGRVADHLAGPVAGVRHDDGEALGCRSVVVRDGCEGVPLEEGFRRDLQAVERLHVAVLKMQTRGVAREHFRVHLDVAQTAPREKRAACRDAQRPEVGCVDDVASERRR
ncbi:unnamed protein product [Mycena citricolor]|uniref:Uncharacterized protein n=1 Tax=Mycena citricolor TaxID=2018698 RepID=A0AAD2HFX9_9AGAR|nr:unnamed protein product [Mycena citricolor]CAK5275151.1 unnamed protein product [Mycena citricolor]